MEIKNRKMAAIMQPHVAEIHEEALEPMGDTDLLLKMENNNICTTDYQQWQGLRDYMGFPMAGGHEWCGIIIDKGPKVSPDFSIGDRVAYGPEGCGACINCRSGHNSDCSSIGDTRTVKVNGFIGDRGFCNYKVINQKAAFKVPADIPAAEASFLEPLASVVHGIKLVDVRPMDNVVVLGAGTMGLLNAQVAKAYGARVIITELTPKKLERARSMNLGEVIDSAHTDPVEEVKRLTGGRGADIVIPAVGNSIAYQQAYNMLKENYGKMLIFAAGHPEPELKINPNEIHYRRISIIGTFDCDTVDFFEAAQLMNQKMVHCGFSLEGKTFALKDIQKAYEAAATPDAYRISVDLQDV